MGDDEVHVFRPDFFGGHNQVSLVLPVLVICYDNHLSAADFINGLFNLRKYFIVSLHV